MALCSNSWSLRVYDSSLTYPHYVAQSDVTPIPEDSVVTVVNSNGQAQSHVPVRVVDPSLRDGYPVSLDVDSFWLPRTDSDFKASYQAMFNEHGYTTKNLLEQIILENLDLQYLQAFHIKLYLLQNIKAFGIIVQIILLYFLQARLLRCQLNHL